MTAAISTDHGCKSKRIIAYLFQSSSSFFVSVNNSDGS